MAQGQTVNQTSKKSITFFLVDILTVWLMLQPHKQAGEEDMETFLLAAVVCDH